ncbi:MAG: hypothetical protein RLZZ54_720 [Cyanobacteriota bacterium]|jgi:hypothetical protein
MVWSGSGVVAQLRPATVVRRRAAVDRVWGDLSSRQSARGCGMASPFNSENRAAEIVVHAISSGLLVLNGAGKGSGQHPIP